MKKYLTLLLIACAGLAFASCDDDEPDLPEPPGEEEPGGEEEETPTPGINLYSGYVDLGLSVVWYRCNVGASGSDPIGGYYNWGLTDPCTKGEENFDFWYTGRLDDMLDAEHDAATQALGNGWRTPTQEEFAELTDTTKCRYEWITAEESEYWVPGIRFISKVKGYEGNSIFFPAGGYHAPQGRMYQVGSWGYYWTATHDMPYEEGEATYADSSVSFAFTWDTSKHIGFVTASDSYVRYQGLCIRPCRSRNW